MHTTWIDNCMKGLRFVDVSGLAIRTDGFARRAGVFLALIGQLEPRTALVP